MSDYIVKFYGLCKFCCTVQSRKGTNDHRERREMIKVGQGYGEKLLSLPVLFM